MRPSDRTQTRSAMVALCALACIYLGIMCPMPGLAQNADAGGLRRLRRRLLQPRPVGMTRLPRRQAR